MKFVSCHGMDVIVLLPGTWMIKCFLCLSIIIPFKYSNFFLTSHGFQPYYYYCYCYYYSIAKKCKYAKKALFLQKQGWVFMAIGATTCFSPMNI
ncbi:hypothetical protein L6452_14213 [Arctium lappa]|uniref:Uncharacterized protein n=1 Tax=Arctium lappa TaxID=4217 RepID=A0ACB9CKC0_ARCLA|nr:hypothetical protein L6452_14213 [Arctium lappa]